MSEGYTVVVIEGGYTAQCATCHTLLGVAYPSPDRADAAAWLEAFWSPKYGCENCQKRARYQGFRAKASRNRRRAYGKRAA